MTVLAYRIVICDRAIRKLRHLTAALIVDAIEDQLTHQPTVETRNRQRMRDNRLSLWELRVRDLPANNDVEEDDESSRGVSDIGDRQ